MVASSVAWGQTGPDALTGSWSGRTNCEVQGVAPFAVLTAEGWGNVSGGLHTGAWYNQMLDFGLTLDADKLWGVPGGSVFAQMHWVKNAGPQDSFVDDTGAANPVSNIMAEDHLRVFNLYYRQSWKQDAIVLKVGQMAADDDFMGSAYSALFLNSAFGEMPSQASTSLAACCGGESAFPSFPVAAPGLFLSVKPSEAFYVQGGIYEGHAGADREENYGFDWATEAHQAVALFYEAGYNYSLLGHPATVKLGGDYNSGDFVNYRRLNNQWPDSVQNNFYSLYAVHDWALIADKEKKPVVGLFWRGGIVPEENLSMVQAYADGGLNWFGPLPGRPDDVAGVGVSYTRFSSEFQRFTGPAGSAIDQTAVELTYKVQVTRWFSLQADTQVLLNPALNAAGSRDPAIVLGLRGRLAF